MADSVKHKYKTRASMYNQNVGNGSIVYIDLNSDSSSSDCSDYSESPIGKRKKYFYRSNNKRKKYKEQSIAIFNTINDVPEIQYPSKWLSQTVPTKLPYYPQIDDTVVYFHQGHQMYLEAVKQRYNYVLPLPHSRIKSSLKAYHYCKVTGISFKILPPQICCIKLSIIDDDGHYTGEAFTVKYHYLSQLHDFIVLKQVFDEALKKEFSIGMRICGIKNKHPRLIGTIESVKPINIKFPTSHFLCCRIKWDNGDSDILSPWDLELLDNQNLPSEPGGTSPEISRDIHKFLYQPQPDEWPLQDQDLVCQRMIQYLDQLIYLSIAKNFIRLVDVHISPDYAKVVAYPIDLFIIRARLENGFYRRINTLKFDLRYLRINAEIFNESNSQIVKQATILTDVCFDIVKNIDKKLNIKGLCDKALLRSYVTSDSDIEVESVNTQKPSVSVRSSPKKRTNDCQINALASISSTSFKRFSERQPTRNIFPKNITPGDWKDKCRYLIKIIWDDEDSIPFRYPVDPLEFPDYERIVPIQMCLQWVKNSLELGEYKNPKNFEKDMKMIFSNSKLYNTDHNTEIYKMTTRLSYLFESFMESITRWSADGMKRKPKQNQQSGEHARTRTMDVEEYSSWSESDEDNNDDSDYIPDNQSTIESEDLSQVTEDFSQFSTAVSNALVEEHNQSFHSTPHGINSNPCTRSSALVENVTNFNDAEDDSYEQTKMIGKKAGRKY